MINTARITVSWANPDPKAGRIDSRSQLDVADTRLALAAQSTLEVEGFIVSRFQSHGAPVFDIAWNDIRDTVSTGTRMVQLTEATYLAAVVRDNPGSPDVTELRFVFELLS